MGDLQEGGVPAEKPRDPDSRTPGGQKPEKVEDRPSVGTVDPEDYPLDRPDR